MPDLTDDDRETLTAYLDGELDEEATHALEARIGQDEKLRVELEAMKKTWGLLDFLPKAAPSPDFTNRTVDRLALAGATTQTAGRVERGFWRRMAAWSLASAVALAVGFASAAALRHFTAKPIDPNETLVHDLRLLERLRAYDAVDDLDFLRALDQPDLFGESE